MLTNPTLEKLRGLRLHGMAKCIEEQLNSCEYDSLTFEERLSMMVDREATEQENRGLQSRLRQAKLRQSASIEDIDYRGNRGLDKTVLKSLATCDWIKKHHNVLITGPTGVGKSFIACALGHKACMNGYKVYYIRASRLFEMLALSHEDGRYPRLMRQLSKTDMLIIDDWGLSGLTSRESRDFFEILEDRHDLSSTIITGQMPIKHWHDSIENQTLADAIMDRLIHNAYKIELKGNSMRKGLKEQLG